MTNRKTIFLDAAFTIGYIGVLAAMVCLSVVLTLFVLLDTEFGGLHVLAAFANLGGWISLPFAPRLYRKWTGYDFRWTTNHVLDGSTDT
jgi:hypothetical protein